MTTRPDYRVLTRTWESLGAIRPRGQQDSLADLGSVIAVSAARRDLVVLLRVPAPNFDFSLATLIADLEAAIRSIGTVRSVEVSVPPTLFTQDCSEEAPYTTTFSDRDSEPSAGETSGLRFSPNVWLTLRVNVDDLPRAA